MRSTELSPQLSAERPWRTASAPLSGTLSPLPLEGRYISRQATATRVQSGGDRMALRQTFAALLLACFAFSTSAAAEEGHKGAPEVNRKGDEGAYGLPAEAVTNHA